MKFIKLLPFQSALDNELLPIGLWQSEANICECSKSGEGLCDNSGYYYGTDDETEAHFCARHFYQLIVSGGGVSNYKLSDIEG